MEPPFLLSFPACKRSVDSYQAQTHTPKGVLKDRHITGLNRFPFNNFTYYLTLFSKFFSSFPHGTCSLSVSCLYLALDDMYHPFWTAFPNNPTLWAAFILTHAMTQTGMSPSLLSLSRELWPSRLSKDDSLNDNSDTHTDARFQIWALPVSLAVTLGILVSFFSSAYWYA